MPATRIIYIFTRLVTINHSRWTTVRGWHHRVYYRHKHESSRRELLIASVKTLEEKISLFLSLSRAECTAIIIQDVERILNKHPRPSRRRKSLIEYSR